MAEVPSDINAKANSSTVDDSSSAAADDLKDRDLKKNLEQTAEIDRILAIEDPSLAEAMKDLAEIGDIGDLGSDGPISDMLVVSAVQSGTAERSIKSRLVHAVNFIRITLQGGLGAVASKLTSVSLKALLALIYWLKKFVKESLPHAIKSAFFAIRAFLNYLIGLPSKAKGQLLLVLILAAALVLVVRITFVGHFMPAFESRFMGSFADMADEKFQFSKEETWESFDDPMLHPEHVVLIERLIVNLKRSETSTSNSMALVELYLESSTKEAAMEIADREPEIRDLVSRVLERIPSDHLQTQLGKEKLKIILRKNINDFLTRGRVHRVFYKTIVINP
jgi:flagellar basal body-associated protein FliL